MDSVLVREMIFVSYSGCGGGKVIHKKRILTTRRLHCPLTFLFSFALFYVLGYLFRNPFNWKISSRGTIIVSNSIQRGTRPGNRRNHPTNVPPHSLWISIRIQFPSFSLALQESVPGHNTQFVHMFDSMLYRAQSRREFIDTYNRCPLNW